MKFLIAFAAFAAVAVAGPILPGGLVTPVGGASPIVDEMGNHVILEPASNFPAVSPIAVGPAIVDVPAVSPIAIGPAIVDMPAASPIAIGPAIVDFPVNHFPEPSPAVEPVAAPAADAPLVQIIINVNGQESSLVIPGAVSEPVVSGVSVATPVIPGPVNVVDSIAVPVSPVSVGTPVVVSPVSVGTPVEVSPVSVGTPVEVSPVSVGTPVAVSPVAVGTPVEVSPVAVGTPVEVTPVSVAGPILPVPVSQPATLN